MVDVHCCGPLSFIVIICLISHCQSLWSIVVMVGHHQLLLQLLQQVIHLHLQKIKADVKANLNKPNMKHSMLASFGHPSLIIPKLFFVLVHLVAAHYCQLLVIVLVHSYGGPSFWWSVILHQHYSSSLFLVHCGQSKTPYVIRHKQGENGFHHLVERCLSFHICSKNVQLNKFKTFLLTEMTNKKKMVLPQQEDKDQPCLATATMMRQ